VVIHIVLIIIHQLMRLVLIMMMMKIYINSMQQLIESIRDELMENIEIISKTVNENHKTPIGFYINYDSKLDCIHISRLAASNNYLFNLL